MVKRNTALIGTLFCCLIFAPVKNILATGFPLLNKSNYPLGKISDTSYYTDKELYGYINGGAEIYREYGFVKLAVQELVKDSTEFKIDIYQMTDSLAAFGIFSISHNDCESGADFAEFLCQTQYQLIMARGPFYVTVTNFDGSKSSQDESAKIARIISKQILQRDFSMPDAYRHPFHDQNRGNLKYIKGPLGVRNQLGTWIELFEGFPSYEIYFLRIEQEDDWAKAVKIIFPEREDVDFFYSRIRLEDPEKNEDRWRMKLSPDIWRTARFRGNGTVLFVEVTRDYPHFDMLLKSMVPEDW